MVVYHVTNDYVSLLFKNHNRSLMYKLWSILIDNVKSRNKPQMNLTVLYIGFECCKYDFPFISFA